MQQQDSYWRGVYSSLPYAWVAGLVVFVIAWLLDDFQSAVGLALAGFAAAALVPFRPRGRGRE